MLPRLQEGKKYTITRFEEILNIHFIYRKYKPIDYVKKYSAHLEPKTNLDTINILTRSYSEFTKALDYNVNDVGNVYEILELRTEYYQLYSYPKYILTFVVKDEVCIYYKHGIISSPLNIEEQKEFINNSQLCQTFDCLYTDINIHFFLSTASKDKVINNFSEKFKIKKVTLKHLEESISNKDIKYLETLKNIFMDNNNIFDVYLIGSCKENNYQSKFNNYFINKSNKKSGLSYQEMYFILKVNEDGCFSIWETLEKQVNYYNESLENFLINNLRWRRLNYYSWTYSNIIDDEYNKIYIYSRTIPKVEEELKEKCEYQKVKFSSINKVEEYLDLYKFGYNEDIIQNILRICRVNEVVRYIYILTKKKKDCHLYIKRQEIDGKEIIYYPKLDIYSKDGYSIDIYRFLVANVDFEINKNLNDYSGNYEEI